MIEDDDEQETIQTTKQPNFLIPGIPKQVVLISELQDENQIGLSDEIPVHPPTYGIEPLNFTFSEEFLNDKGYDCLQLKGLLQVVKDHKRFKTRLSNDEPIETFIMPSHIELLIATKENFKPDWEFYEKHHTAVSLIHFLDLENVYLESGLVRNSIIFKFKPRAEIRYFEVDFIERELTLNIFRKDVELAKQTISIIVDKISKTKAKN